MRTGLSRAAARTLRSPKLVLVVAPMLVFWPFLFGGYSLTQNSVGLVPGTPYLGLSVLPVADPAGSALLDEAYLVDLARHLARGQVPLLNMRNALGAPGVECLHSFYVLNPLLLLLPTSGPLYYDLFQLLHVLIALLGFYYLLRLYVQPFAAVAASVLVVLSGVTFTWINLENYRSFAWTPLMIAGAAGLARGQNVRRHGWMFFAAAVAAGTAGNPQEFALGLLASAMVYATERWVAGHRPARSSLAFPLCLLAAVSVAAVAILPFLVSRHTGELWITNQPDRSVRPYDVAWLFSWVLPRVQGFHPYLFIQNRPYWPHSDLSTTGFLLLVLGAMAAWRRPRLALQTPASAVAAMAAVVIPLGLAKVAAAQVLAFVRYLPLVREVFFIKYHLYLFALAAVHIAVGLERTVELERGQRRRRLLVAVGVVAAVIAAIVALVRGGRAVQLPTLRTRPRR